MELGNIIHAGILSQWVEKSGGRKEVKYPSGMLWGTPVSFKVDYISADLNSLKELKVRFSNKPGDEIEKSHEIQTKMYKLILEIKLAELVYYFPFDGGVYEVFQYETLSPDDINYIRDRVDLFSNMIKDNSGVCLPSPGECNWCLVKSCPRRTLENKYILTEDQAGEDVEYLRVTDNMKVLELKKKYLASRLKLRQSWGNYEFEYSGLKYSTRFQRGMSAPSYSIPNEIKEKYRKSSGTEYYYPIVKLLSDKF